MLVSCVNPVAILSAVFCIIWSLSMLVSHVLGDQMVETYSSTGLVMPLYVASMVCLCSPFCRGEDVEYVDCLACFGCGQVDVYIVSEFGVKCESQYVGCVVMGSVVYLKSELCAIYCWVWGE